MQAQDHYAVVIPAFNEAEGLPAFLSEIRASFAARGASVTLIVVDDASTDNTPTAADDYADVVRAPRNRGHGPTALAAYAEGLRSGADVVVHVDGDGQFHGDDIVRVAAALDAAATDVVHGVRRGRTDPWFRRCLSALVRFIVLILCGRSVPDVNTPLRAYDPSALRRLIDGVPAEALVPHVHFSIAEARDRLRVRYVSVESIPRRGGAAQGTMWGAGRTRVVPPASASRPLRSTGARRSLAGGRPASPGPDRTPRRPRRGSARLTMRLLIAAVGLGLCGAVVLAATLSPTPIDQGYEGAIERVLSVLHRNGVPGWFGYRWVEFTANIAMFVPLGFFLALVFPTRFLWLALPLVPAFSVLLETLQFFVLPARFATINDVVANTIGGWLGVAVAALTVAAVHLRDRRVLMRWREQNVIGVRESVS